MPDIQTIDQLRELLGPNRRQFLELWVTKDNGQALCALINDQTGWLMYLREECDAGFSSRNPDYQGPEAAIIEYALDNGQLDTYPASWALPIADVQRALEHFIALSQPADWITWHNDSGDGAVNEKNG